MIVLARRRFNPGAELARFCRDRPSTGAVTSFVGLARGASVGQAALVLEAYEGFTEAEIGRIVDQAVEKFRIQDVRIVHRIGVIEVGEPIVMVITAAAHRRAAFEACDFLMDQLKSQAPLWKQELSAGKPRWIEPTAADLADARRWDEPRASGGG